MAFPSFQSIEQLAERFGIEFRRDAFVAPVAGARLHELVRAELDLTVHGVPYQRSEVHAREALIYPLIREAWKPFRDHLTLLSGETVEASAELAGEIDYVICRRSPLGPLVPDRPFLFVGEAKRDDSSGGWSQALGGMIAARLLSGPNFTFYGATTTGGNWRFGKLEGDRFTQDPRPFGIGDPDELLGALQFVFAACRDHVLAAPSHSLPPTLVTPP
ncbi:MAG: hypothetical protein ACRC7O_09805 [Fimbriiglobus sp.]